MASLVDRLRHRLRRGPTGARGRARLLALPLLVVLAPLMLILLALLGLVAGVALLRGSRRRPPHRGPAAPAPDTERRRGVVIDGDYEELR